MLRCAKFIFLQLLLVLSAVFLLASFAQAGQGHEHHQVVSPFDKVSAPLHCLLNAHRKKIDCPHRADRSKNSKSAEFRADCGSHPGASHSKGFSFGSDFPQDTQDDEFDHQLASHSFYLLLDDNVRLFPRSIEHPPQLS